MLPKGPSVKLTQMIFLVANVDAINNFTIKIEELKRQRDNLKVS